MPNSFSIDDVGVWIDIKDLYTMYIGEEIQHIAKKHGWTGELRDQHSYSNEDMDKFRCATEEAEEYLNQFVPDGHMFGTMKDGSFGLFPLSMREIPLA